MSSIKTLSLLLIVCHSVMATESDVIPFAAIRNLVNNGADCDGKTTITYGEDGSAAIVFNDIVASRTSERPFAKCLIHGEVVLPAGFLLEPSQFADAQFTTQYSKPGDQSGGRLRLELHDAVSSSIAMSKANEQIEDTVMTLKNAIPSFKACGSERVLPLKLTVEAMINYRLDEPSNVSSRLDAIRLPSLRIVPTSCSEESP